MSHDFKKKWIKITIIFPLPILQESKILVTFVWWGWEAINTLRLVEGEYIVTTPERAPWHVYIQMCVCVNFKQVSSLTQHFYFLEFIQQIYLCIYEI